jgi:methyl-accepting chemotaxis protein-1 (serine sensor receptor)
MKFENLSIRAKLTTAFGGLAVIVLLVSGVAIHALGLSHKAFIDYVGETSRRVAYANEVHDATLARAVGARNLLLLKSPAELAAEKNAVTAAHEKVGASILKIKKGTRQL